MRNPFAKAPWLRGYTVLLFGMLGLLGVYYFWYAPLRQRRAESRSFRLLADLSDQIRTSIEGLAGPLANVTAQSTNLESAVRLVHDTGVRNLQVLEFSPNSPATGSLSGTLSCRLTTTNGLPTLLFTQQDTNGNQLTAETLLRPLIDPLAREGDFDDVWVVNASDGQVVYQRGGGEFRVSRIELPPEARERSAMTNVSNGTGERILLFSQPLRAPVADKETESGSSWIVCGLVRSDTFYKETLAVPYSWTIPIVLLLLLAPLAWPFLNAHFLGDAGGRLPRRVCAAYLAALAGSALILLGCLMLSGYGSLERRLDVQLRPMAKSMVAGFRSEVQRGVDQLQEFDRAFRADPTRTNLTDILTYGFTDSNAQAGDACPDRSLYPYFKMAVWIDTNGMQVAKWTRERRNTPFIAVGKRDYFRRVLWHREWATWSGRVFIEPIYSMNTGENLAELSMWSNDGKRVMTLTVRFLTFFQPVLPADFGFCVVDGTGRLLFHADENRNLRENFVAECDGDAALVAALRARTEEGFDTMYCGRPHSLFVTPIPDLPWSLIVYRNESSLQAIEMATLTVAMGLYLCGLVLMLVLVCALYAAKPDLRWVRPAHRRRKRYLALAAFCLAFSVLALMVGLGVEAVPAWVTAVLLPLIGAAAACSLLHRSPMGERDEVVESVDVEKLRWKGLHGWLTGLWSAPWKRLAAWVKKPFCPTEAAYWLALSAVIVLSSVVPALLLFNSVFGAEIQAMVQRGQRHLAEDMETRKERIWKQYGRLSVPPGFVEQRITNEARDCYFSDFFQTSFTRKTTVHDVKRPPRPSAVGRLLAKVDQRNAAYFNGGARDGAWRWEKGPNGRVLELFIDENDREKKFGRWGSVISSKLPETGWWPWLTSGGVGVLIALFLAWRMTLDFMPRKERRAEKGVGQKAGDGKGRGATWNAFRGPLLVAVLIVMFVVFSTQKALWEGTVGLLPAFAAGLTAVISALKLFWEYKEKKPDGGG